MKNANSRPLLHPRTLDRLVHAAFLLGCLVGLYALYSTARLALTLTFALLK